MSGLNTISQQIKNLLDRHREGDAAAREELINYANNRLITLTRMMLGRNDRLRQWEQTDDVAQNASLRLYRAMAAVQPAGVKEFFQLATEQIRREILDLIRHHLGRGAERAKIVKSSELPETAANPLQQASDGGSMDPSGLELWERFHEYVRSMPEYERLLVEYLWYQGLTQEEAAELLQVSISRVKQDWRSVRVKLKPLLVQMSE